MVAVIMCMSLNFKVTYIFNALHIKKEYYQPELRKIVVKSKETYYVIALCYIGVSRRQFDPNMIWLFPYDNGPACPAALQCLTGCITTIEGDSIM